MKYLDFATNEDTRTTIGTAPSVVPIRLDDLIEILSQHIALRTVYGAERGRYEFTDDQRKQLRHRIQNVRQILSVCDPHQKVAVLDYLRSGLRQRRSLVRRPAFA